MNLRKAYIHGYLAAIKYFQMFVAMAKSKESTQSVYLMEYSLDVDFDAYAKADAVFVSTSFTQMSKSIFIPL